MLLLFKFLQLLVVLSVISSESLEPQRQLACVILDHEKQTILLNDKDDNLIEEIKFSENYRSGSPHSGREWEIIKVPNSDMEFFIKNSNGKYLYERPMFKNQKFQKVLALKVYDTSMLNCSFKWTFNEPGSLQVFDLFTYVKDFRATKVVDFFEITNVNSWKLLATKKTWFRKLAWFIEKLKGSLITSHINDQSNWALECRDI